MACRVNKQSHVSKVGGCQGSLLGHYVIISIFRERGTVHDLNTVNSVATPQIKGIGNVSVRVTKTLCA